MRKRSDKWSQWESRILNKCEQLASKFGGSYLSVGLRGIAEQCRVRRVVFRPLLIEGGLGRCGDGFVMYVKCHLERVKGFETSYMKRDGHDLPARTRFTIAHEIVHTLFFDMSGKIPKSRISGEHSSELKALERTCDMGANRLLLPKGRLEQVLRNEPILSPSKIVALARRLNVSIDSLLIRLSQVPFWGDECGAVFLVDARNAMPKIEGMAIASLAQSFFPTASRGAELMSLLGAQELVVFGGNKKEVSQLLSLRSGRTQEFRLACEPCNPTATKFVVTALIGR